MTQSNIDTMQSQLETSKKELKDVEKLLAEAEEQAKQGGEGSNKRRKISPETVSSGITVKMEEDNDYDKETDNEEDPNDTNSAGVTVKREEESGIGPAPECQILDTIPLKKCHYCGKPKKKHSYLIAEWDKRDDGQRVCRVCTYDPDYYLGILPDCADVIK